MFESGEIVLKVLTLRVNQLVHGDTKLTSSHACTVFQSMNSSACPAMLCWCRFQPTEEESEIYKNYKGKVNELTEVDQFLQEVRTACVCVYLCYSLFLCICVLREGYCPNLHCLSFSW